MREFLRPSARFSLKYLPNIVSVSDAAHIFDRDHYVDKYMRLKYRMDDKWLEQPSIVPDRAWTQVGSSRHSSFMTQSMISIAPPSHGVAILDSVGDTFGIVASYDFADAKLVKCYRLDRANHVLKHMYDMINERGFETATPIYCAGRFCGIDKNNPMRFLMFKLIQD